MNRGVLLSHKKIALKIILHRKMGGSVPHTTHPNFNVTISFNFMPFAIIDGKYYFKTRIIVIFFSFLKVVYTAPLIRHVARILFIGEGGRFKKLQKHYVIFNVLIIYTKIQFVRKYRLFCIIRRYIMNISLIFI